MFYRNKAFFFILFFSVFSLSAAQKQPKSSFMDPVIPYAAAAGSAFFCGQYIAADLAAKVLVGAAAYHVAAQETRDGAAQRVQKMVQQCDPKLTAIIAKTVGEEQLVNAVENNYGYPGGVQKGYAQLKKDLATREKAAKIIEKCCTIKPQSIKPDELEKYKTIKQKIDEEVKISHSALAILRKYSHTSKL